MIIKGTTDFIRLFMLKNHIEYLDEDGWNEVFYYELDQDERELAMDLTPMYEYLLEYVAEPIIDMMKRNGKDIEYINYFGVDIDTEELFMVVNLMNGEQETITIY